MPGKKKMRPIPPKHRKIIDENVYFKQCARQAIFGDHNCQGRLTIEHALIYAGRQVAEIWAYVPLCAYSHGVDEFQGIRGILDKRKNEYLALSRATPKELAQYPKSDWSQKLKYLTMKYKKEVSNVTMDPMF